MSTWNKAAATEHVGGRKELILNPRCEQLSALMELVRHLTNVEFPKYDDHCT
jgi:hypothetical protein